jgi:hypothetical protein
MAQSIIGVNEFDATTSIQFGNSKTNARGGKAVPIKNNQNKQLYISTPLMLTWGVNVNDYDNNGKFTYDMSLQFPRESDSNFNAETQKFLNNLIALENRVKEETIKNGKEWFNKKMSKEVVGALFTPMLKYPKGEDGEPDKSRMPTLRVKIPCWDGKFNIELYNLKNELIFPDENNEDLTPDLLIQKGQNVATVLECGGVWFAGGKFGVTWRLVQAVVEPKATLKGKCHIQLSISDKESMVQATKQLESVVEPMVADSDEEDEEEKQEDAEEEAPVTPPPAPKKRGRKKAVSVEA